MHRAFTRHGVEDTRRYTTQILDRIEMPVRLEGNSLWTLFVLIISYFIMAIAIPPIQTLLICGANLSLVSASAMLPILFSL
jgi:hypothetical protein